MSNKPVHTIRQGNIEAAIWKNETGHGLFFSTTFTRRYREGTDFKNATNFGQADLLRIARLAHLAEAWIDVQQS